MRDPFYLYDDLGDNPVDLDVPPETQRLISHPSFFGAVVGLTNGLIAAARDKPITVRGAVATTLVLAAGEALLSADETTQQRGGRPPLLIGVLSGLGVLAGIAPFTDWTVWAGGDRPILIARGETAPQDRQAIVPPAPTMTA